MAHCRTMSSRVSKLCLKCPCFGGKTIQEEAENENLGLNHPKIIVTECKESAESSPNISRKNSSSGSSSASYDENETEIKIKSNGTVYEMGLRLCLKTKDSSEDTVDGRVGNEVASMIFVNDVKQGSFAHGFGLRKGDLITKINDKECNKVQEIEKAFLHKSSDELIVEILRKSRNQERGTELMKMAISNATCTEGSKETVIEAIQVEMGSTWSLSDNYKYFIQDYVEEGYLQFAISDNIWVVRDGDKLALADHLSQNDEENAKFRIHKYWSMSTRSDPGITVAIQHVQSGLCVTFNHASIYFEEVHNLRKAEGDEPFLFDMHTELPNGNGMKKTFKSLKDSSRYIGFNVPDETNAVYAEPIFVKATPQDPLGNEHQKVVFVFVTD